MSSNTNEDVPPAATTSWQEDISATATAVGEGVETGGPSGGGDQTSPPPAPSDLGDATGPAAAAATAEPPADAAATDAAAGAAGAPAANKGVTIPAVVGGAAVTAGNAGGEKRMSLVARMAARKVALAVEPTLSPATEESINDVSEAVAEIERAAFAEANEAAPPAAKVNRAEEGSGGDGGDGGRSSRSPQSTKVNPIDPPSAEANREELRRQMKRLLKWRTAYEPNVVAGLPISEHLLCTVLCATALVRGTVGGSPDMTRRQWLPEVVSETLAEIKEDALDGGVSAGVDSLEALWAHWVAHVIDVARGQSTAAEPPEMSTSPLPRALSAGMSPADLLSKDAPGSRGSANASPAPLASALVMPGGLAPPAPLTRPIAAPLPAGAQPLRPQQLLTQQSPPPQHYNVPSSAPLPPMPQHHQHQHQHQQHQNPSFVSPAPSLQQQQQQPPAYGARSQQQQQQQQQLLHPPPPQYGSGNAPSHHQPPSHFQLQPPQAPPQHPPGHFQLQPPQYGSPSQQQQPNHHAAAGGPIGASSSTPAPAVSSTAATLAALQACRNLPDEPFSPERCGFTAASADYLAADLRWSAMQKRHFAVWARRMKRGFTPKMLASDLGVLNADDRIIAPLVDVPSKVSLHKFRAQPKRVTDMLPDVSEAWNVTSLIVVSMKVAPTVGSTARRGIVIIMTDLAGQPVYVSSSSSPDERSAWEAMVKETGHAPWMSEHASPFIVAPAAFAGVDERIMTTVKAEANDTERRLQNEILTRLMLPATRLREWLVGFEGVIRPVSEADVAGDAVRFLVYAYTVGRLAEQGVGGTPFVKGAHAVREEPGHKAAAAGSTTAAPVVSAAAAGGLPSYGQNNSNNHYHGGHHGHHQQQPMPQQQQQVGGGNGGRPYHHHQHHQGTGGHSSYPPRHGRI